MGAGNLGLALHEAGGYQEARATLARALAITVAARGGEHPNVAKILTSLAMVERALDLAKAGEQVARFVARGQRHA